MADERILMITGGSSGIGSETARHAVRAGYRLALGARRLGPIEELAAELGEGKATAVSCDVAEWEQVQAFVNTTIETFGHIDAVFANAGVGAASGLMEDSVENWRSMVLTNVYGTALTVRAALPHLLERGTGHVLITSSVAGRRVVAGSLYSVTKWATTALAEALRLELREVHGNAAIKVTVIAPGVVETPFFDSIGAPPWAGLQPADVARAVVYALEQPGHVDVSEMLIRPTTQAF